MNRIDEGFCHWMNPFNANQLFRVPMGADDVAAIVFWTRNAGPMLPDVARLQNAGYAFYTQYTINGYPREIEHRSPEVERAIETLRALSDATAPERVIWRYDPIILSSATPPEYHFERFEALAGEISGAVRDVYISFCDPYGRTERHFKAMSERLGWTFEFGARGQHIEMATRMAEIAAARDMQLYSCAEAGLDIPGIRRGSCIDPNLVAELRPDLDFHLKAAPTREGCGCVQAVDIGSFDTCVFGCEYCYANNSLDLPQRRMKEHDPSDSMLWRPPSLRGEDLSEIAGDQKSARIERRQGGEQLSIL
ncbi:MAG: hypothetical protein FD171_2160 [Actinobacteria bacterium]|nr:MAG: hypothetical protein FD171_2160 [Actinomycetota bacterium]